MGRSRSKRNPVTVRGDWLPMPLEFFRSRACAELSPKGLRMLIDLCAQLGPNASGNGDLSAAPADMKARGWTGNGSRVAALQELIDAALLVITRHGDRRRCTLYALTLWPMQCDFSKLDVGPGCYATSDWAKGSRERSEKPTKEQPAAWKVLRANEISPPATGQPPSVMHPPRDKLKGRQDSYAPTTGT